MADAGIPRLTETRYAAAREEIDSELVRLGWRRIRPERLSDVPLAGATAAWTCRLLFSDGVERELGLAVTRGFPFAAARLFLTDRAMVLIWPHVEEKGLLCVFPSEAAVSNERPLDAVRSLIHEGVKLLERNISGEALDDFRNEFISYWCLEGIDPKVRVLSLLQPGGDHRMVIGVRRKNTLAIGEDQNAVGAWISNFTGGGAPVKASEFLHVVLLRLDNAPLPEDYPRTSAGLLKLVAGDKAAGELLAREVVGNTVPHVVLSVRTVSGTGFAAVRVSAPARHGPPRQRRDTTGDGFRPGRLPAKWALLRGFSPAAKVDRYRASRVDHDWVHGRDFDTGQLQLKSKKIAVVGAGSLGSGIADLLARAGVGRMIIIDPEQLQWENLSRHRLGAPDVTSAKSEALALRLRESLPHLGDIRGMHARLDAVDPEELADADLIVATTGSWQADAWLNEMQREHRLPPVLYTWLEAHAAAAHALYIPPKEACLRCGFTELGSPLRPVTKWDVDTRIAVPACGGAFTPYGAADLAWAHALGSAEAVRLLTAPQEEAGYRVWIGDTTRLPMLGGRISDEWIAAHGDPGDGGFTIRPAWPRADGCPVCGERHD